MRKITFRLPEDKPDGLIVQDELLKGWKPCVVWFGQTFIEETTVSTLGWSTNQSTGEINFTEVGGVADGILTMLCNKYENT